MRCLLTVLLMLLTLVVTTSRTEAQRAEREVVLKAPETALLSWDVEAVLQLFADDTLAVTSSGRLLRGMTRSGAGCKIKWSGANARKRAPSTSGPRFRARRQGLHRRLCR